MTDNKQTDWLSVSERKWEKKWTGHTDIQTHTDRGQKEEQIHYSFRSSEYCVCPILFFFRIKSHNDKRIVFLVSAKHLNTFIGRLPCNLMRNRKIRVKTHRLRDSGFLLFCRFHSIAQQSNLFASHLCFRLCMALWPGFDRKEYWMRNNKYPLVCYIHLKSWSNRMRNPINRWMKIVSLSLYLTCSLILINIMWIVYIAFQCLLFSDDWLRRRFFFKCCDNMSFYSPIGHMGYASTRHTIYWTFYNSTPISSALGVCISTKNKHLCQYLLL